VAVWWRCCTIVTGVIICTLTTSLILPVYASDVARATLAECLSCSAALLSGVVDVYTSSSPSTSDERHAALHELEGQLCGSVERLRPLMAQAQEESLCCGLLTGGRPLAGPAFAAACGRARLLYTGAVSLLHFEESLGEAAQEALGVCARHVGDVHAARDALVLAVRATAAGIASNVDVSASALACELEGAEAAVSTLLRAVSGATIGGGPASEVEALGHLCFALADALRQLKQAVVDLDPDEGPAAVAALEKRAAAAAAAAVCEAAPPDDGVSLRVQQPSPLMARATRRMSVVGALT
jgi:hypothetical protein